MDFTKLITNFFLLISLFSCTTIIKNMEGKSVPLKPMSNRIGYCEKPTSKTILLGRDKSGVKVFNKFLKQVSKVKKLSRIEQMIAWSLFQMNQRPDLASPSAKFQILIKNKKGIQFWDFKDSSLERDFPRSAPSMSFLYGLETVLKTYSSSRSLKEIAFLLDSYLPLKIPISSDFAEFLSTNRSKLLSQKVFSKEFFKAGEQLHYGESITRLSYTKIIRGYYHFKNRASNEITTSNQLYSYPLPSSKDEVLCNVDIKKYEGNVYQINSDNRERHHPYAMHFPDGQFFLAITSISGRNFRPMLGSYLMDTSQDQVSVPLCYKQTEKGTHAYLSFKGRDPGQHLYNLFQYNIHKSESVAELDQYLKFPRHLILKDPLRLLFESSRGTDKDLNNFLKKDIPVYHSQGLGEVWVYSPDSGFVIDDRGKAHLSCMK